jgi:hypothetical protein
MTNDAYGEYGDILKKPLDSNDLNDSNMKLPI